MWIKKNAEISQHVGIAIAELKTFDMCAKVERAFVHRQAPEQAHVMRWRPRLAEPQADDRELSLSTRPRLDRKDKTQGAKSLLGPRLKQLKESEPDNTRRRQCARKVRRGSVRLLS